jgi:HSP20 family molecular chaperone IbpA
MTNLITKTFRPTFQDNIFDILVRDIFDQTSIFSPVPEAKIHYPVDIKETKTGLQFEFAIVGVDKKDVGIEVENDTLRISYENKISNDASDVYIHRGITRKSFNFAWKLGAKYDSSKVEADMNMGILTIKVPLAKAMDKKKIEIR